jgi:hypothetical protein
MKKDPSVYLLGKIAGMAFFNLLKRIILIWLILGELWFTSLFLDSGIWKVARKHFFFNFYWKIATFRKKRCLNTLNYCLKFELFFSHTKNFQKVCNAMLISSVPTHTGYKEILIAHFCASEKQSNSSLVIFHLYILYTIYIDSEPIYIYGYMHFTWW